MQSTKIGKYMVWYENSEEFNELKREVWSHHAYYLEDLEEPKRVIDMGAHIGLATLYFAQIYPNAEIVAYEPDPQNYELLVMNVVENGIAERVTCINAAVAPKSGRLKLQAPIYPDEWRSGVGIIPKGWRNVLHTKEMEVEAIGIGEIIEKGADLIKIDIEGMEYEVVKYGKWNRVRNLILEVHPRDGKRIGEIEKCLIDQGYKIEKRMDESKYGVGLCMIVAHRV
ncbi:MAG: hypothetical protein Fur0011_2070 [Candidatus Microgenomates bacterium]